MPEGFPDILRVRDLRILSLPPVSFSLRKGECLAIVGSSGVGKSLLLKSVADLVASGQGGKIWFGSRECRDIPAMRWRKNIRYIAAESGWWAEYVFEHFKDIEKVRPQMSGFGLETALLEKAVVTLSTGQKQRLGLLRGMADSPPVLLLDEPTASLDEKNRELVEQVIKKRLGQGTAICMVTHDMRQARRIAQSVLVLGPDKVVLEAL